MRRLSAAILLLTLGAGTAGAAELADRETLVDLSGAWLFHAGDNLTFADPVFDDREWDPRLLPSAGTPWKHRWHGHGWYRLHLRVWPQALGAELAITLGPARHVLEVYANGARVAMRGRFAAQPRGGPTVTHLWGTIQPGVLQAGDNVIALRVYDPTGSGGVARGPLLLGPLDAVRVRGETQSLLALWLRVGLGSLALWLAFLHLVAFAGRRSGRDSFWLAGAGATLSVLLLGGTGVLERLIPSLELAVHLPAVAGALAVLCLGSYFAARFDDWSASTPAYGRYGLLALAAALFLVPEWALDLGGDVALLVAALVVGLYAANLLSKAVRRMEQGAVPAFVALLGLVGCLVYDGMWARGTNVVPPLAAIGAVALLAMITALQPRQAQREHERVLSTMLRLRRESEGRVSLSVLEATTLFVTTPSAFLAAVVNEAGEQLQVRRCSLMLPRPDGALEIHASVGLPSDADRVMAREGTMAGWVFTHGEPVTSAALPDELAQRRRRTGYNSEGFVCYPVQYGNRTLGVLAVSDRNDGGPFTAAHEGAIAAVAQRLGLLLGRPDRFAVATVRASQTRLAGSNKPSEEREPPPRTATAATSTPAQRAPAPPRAVKAEAPAPDATQAAGTAGEESPAEKPAAPAVDHEGGLSLAGDPDLAEALGALDEPAKSH